MRIFAIGDLHLSFASGKPMGVFGKHWDDHHLRLESNWRDAVADEDLVIVPGDISWALDPDEAMVDLNWLDGLPGRKVIVKGNHDYWWKSLSRLKHLLPPGIEPLQHSAIRRGDVIVAGTRGWLHPGHEEYDEIHDGKILRRELLRLEMALDEAERLGSTGSRLIVMLHYPPIVNGRETGFSRLIGDRGADYCVYGHLHAPPGCWPDNVDIELSGVRYRLVSADRLDFRPMQLEV